MILHFEGLVFATCRTFYIDGQERDEGPPGREQHVAARGADLPDEGLRLRRDEAVVGHERAVDVERDQQPLRGNDRVLGILGDLLDQLGVEGGQVVGRPAGDEAVVDHDLLVDPGGARVGEVGSQALVGGHRAAAQHVSVGEDPAAVADHRHGLARVEERAGERDGGLVDAQVAASDYVTGAEDLLLAPARAIPELLARNGLTLDDFDLIEIHEAFAGTVLATLKALEEGGVGTVDRAKLNVNGSSLAAGHPFAATGGRIVASLAKALAARGPGSRGLISICAAGGQGVVAILEAV